MLLTCSIFLLAVTLPLWIYLKVSKRDALDEELDFEWGLNNDRVL